MMTLTFAAFEAESKALGFDEVAVRVWPALTVLPTHTHPFAAHALVVEGEMWLQVGSATQHLLAGDRFALDAQVPHDERYGPSGATYWVARREPPIR